FVATTAMFIFQLRFFASASAAAKICFAFSAVIAVPYGMSKGMASGVPPDGGFAGGCCAIAWLPTSSARVNAEAIETNRAMKLLPTMLLRIIAGTHRSAGDVKNILETASIGFNRKPKPS